MCVQKAANEREKNFLESENRYILGTIRRKGTLTWRRILLKEQHLNRGKKAGPGLHRRIMSKAG